MVHGPESVYSGEAGEQIAFLKGIGHTRVIAGGTMCRTAVIDKKLLEEIDISRCDLPSIALSSLSDYDVLVLINHGKTLESGIAFGNIVSGKVTPARAVLQIERPS